MLSLALILVIKKQATYRQMVKLTLLVLKQVILEKLWKRIGSILKRTNYLLWKMCELNFHKWYSVSFLAHSVSEVTYWSFAQRAQLQYVALETEHFHQVLPPGCTAGRLSGNELTQSTAPRKSISKRCRLLQFTVRNSYFLKETFIYNMSHVKI